MHIEQALVLERRWNQITEIQETEVVKGDTKPHIFPMSAVHEEKGKHSQANVPRGNHNCGTSQFEIRAI